MPIALFLLLGLCVGVDSQAITPPLITACVGSNVSFDWNLNTTTPAPKEIRWTSKRPGSQGLIALYVSDYFFVPSPQRVKVTGEGGLTLIGVTPDDSGLYSVLLETKDSEGRHVEQHSSRYLSVETGLTTNDGKLHVQQERKAFWDSNLNQWVVRLSCGVFSFLNRPSFDVKWTTPSGHSLSSSSYGQGKFFLHLVAPVPGGKYRCHVPSTHLHLACLTPGDTDQAKVKGRIEVDPLLATVLIMEARQTTLKQQVVQLKKMDSTLSNENHDLKEEVVHLEKVASNLTRDNEELKDQVGELKLADTELEQKVIKDNEDTDREIAQLRVNLLHTFHGENYVLAFRLTPRINQSAYNTYIKVGHNDDDPSVRANMPAGCLTVDGSQPCDRHYRSKVLDLWAKLNVQKVRLVVYKNKREVSYFEFNAVKTDYINWFSVNKVTGTSYTDFFSQPKNYCSLQGHASDHVTRRFFINRNYDGCAKDEGWLVVADKREVCGPTWGSDPPFPVVGYSLGRTYHRWSDRNNIRFDADVMAIWVKMAAN